MGIVTEYVIAFAKNIKNSPSFIEGLTEEGKKYPLNNAGNGLKKITFPAQSVIFRCGDQVLEPQDMSEGNIKTKLLNTLVIENGRNVSEFSLEGEWRYSQDTIIKIIEDGELIVISKVPFRPNHIKSGNEPKKIKNLLSRAHYDIQTNEDATEELEAILGNKAFTYPKPSGLIKILLRAVTDGDSIILDSFAGSGTTAHAVLALNKEDGGNRKFILVEMEDYADTITAKRVRRVIKGVQTAKDTALQQGLGGSFTFCTLGDAFDIEKMLKGEALPTWDALARYVFYTATGKSLKEGTLKANPDYFVGETELYEVYLIYKQDLAFLRSPDCALNSTKVEQIALRGGKKQKLVFAADKFMSQKDLTDKNITFCQLPYAIHKVGV